MKSAPSATLAFILATALAAPALAGSVMRAGAWEVHMKVTATNPETGETKNVADTTMKACMTQAFVDKNPYLTPGVDQEKAAKRGATCTLSDEKPGANAATWTMTCKLKDGTETVAHISNTASAKAMRSEVRQDVTREGHTVPTLVLTTGKYIGKCTSDMIEL